MVEEGSSLQSGLQAVQSYSAEKSAKRGTLFFSEVAEQSLPDFCGFKLKGNDLIYIKGTIMSITGLDVWVMTVVRYAA